MHQESVKKEEEKPVPESKKEEAPQEVIGRVYPPGTRIVSLLELEV